ncbi:hypothetical protein DPMN_010595 [Dreissena polymorpha]|uniref:Uncharacterized protein n=1 Tax=Dreissena polymorpha TaxID=45954 RepID=A0A9D4N3H2_DREPO|nr:hypothetical protein DPMN_010595 [Dreissena polymorpha]
MLATLPCRNLIATETPNRTTTDVTDLGGGSSAGGRMTPDGKSQCQLEAIRPNTIIGQTCGQLERLAQNRDAWR